MPASKKPRKKHHHKVTWASAEKHCSFLIRGEDWTPDMLNDFAQDFLFPLDAIYWSRGKDPYCRSLFGRIKDKLVMSWILARYVTETETEQMRRVVAEANKQLQIVFNCWVLHKRILYPQCKRCKDLMLELFQMITSAFGPDEVESCHVAEAKNPALFDWADNELDSHLPAKWDKSGAAIG